ncbi:hypothetical protein [Atlantibacter sp.]|uniref:phage head spike fiber domain-containing protein n=1 Tax=Atlantibacter sp. TaxID=1903473 RepID=UPI0028B0DD13|nr:hypothetical protein [Atlantibacter sp.]
MSAGTLKLTNNSTAVVGTSTLFTTDLKPGDFIVTTIGGVLYTLPVDTVTSNTSATLVSPFTGPTTTGAAWAAVPRRTMNQVTAELVAQSTEALRGLLAEKGVWVQFYTAPGDITVQLSPSVPAVTGPGWQKILELLQAADLDAIKVLADQTRTNATQASSDAASASASAGAAKTSETNSKASENNAKNSETNAAASLAAAQQLTIMPYEAAPEPDVWLPFTDDMIMRNGQGPYDRINIGNQYIELTTRSATFARATTATYFDKTGVMQVAAINEPRFEKGGLMCESAATNLYTQSEMWDAGQRCTITNNSEVSPRGDQTMALMVEDTSATIEHYASDRGIVLTAGTTYCYSVFVKAFTSPRNLYLRVAGASVAGTYFNPVTGSWAGNGGGAQFINRGFEDVGNGIYRVWMVFTAAASQSTVIRIQLANGVTASYTGDGVSGIYFWGAQLEEGTFPTSYIQTTTAAATRAADGWAISNLNAGYKTLAQLFNRTVAFNFAPKYLPVSGYTEVLTAKGPRNDIICRLHTPAKISAYRSSGAIGISSDASDKGVYVHKTEGNKVSLSFAGKTATGTTGPTSTTETLTEIGNISSSTVKYVYYLKNLRIWHSALTDNQINGLR